MAKKRRRSLALWIVVGVLAFITIYIRAFSYWEKENLSESNENTINIEENNVVETDYDILSKLKNSSTVYLKMKNGGDIKIESERWEEAGYYFDEFVKIRNVASYKPVCEGYTSSGIKFSTDYDYFRVYNVEKDDMYKIPISKKDEFKSLLNEGIFTSFEFVSNTENWDSVHISKGEDIKTVHKWKYSNLSENMVCKRPVGKVQPEKSYERTDVNYSMYIEVDGFEIQIDTMGEDYVKITSDNYSNYYEVEKSFYKYIENKIFKGEYK